MEFRCKIRNNNGARYLKPSKEDLELMFKENSVSEEEADDVIVELKFLRVIHKNEY